MTVNTDREKNFVSAVVYLRNDRGRVGEFLSVLCGVLEEHFEKYEIICVNDCCEDDTARRIEDFCRERHPDSLTVVTTGFFQGVEKSMTAGVDMAIGDYVFEFDSPNRDFPPGLVMQVYEKSLSGNDIVFAVPTEGSRFFSRAFYRLFNRYSDMEYEIKTHRFSVISRRGINRVRSIGSRTVYRKAIYASCGLPVAEISYTPLSGRGPNTQKSLQWDLALNSLILFTDIAYRISLGLSLLMALVLMGSGIYTLWVFLSSAPVAGWTTTMRVLSLGFFGLFVLFAITMKYLSLILKLVFQRREYLISRVDKIVK